MNDVSVRMNAVSVSVTETKKKNFLEGILRTIFAEILWTIATANSVVLTGHAPRAKSG